MLMLVTQKKKEEDRFFAKVNKVYKNGINIYVENWVGETGSWFAEEDEEGIEEV